MDRNQNIENLIQATLDQLDHPETLPPRPGLYDRMRIRMDARQPARSFGYLHLKPVLLFGLVLVNFSVAYWYAAGEGGNSRNDARREILELLSTDLNISNDVSSITP